MDSIDETDLELLAALIDGRLSGEEKARALKLLKESDEALEVFAETVRYQAEGEAKVVPISTARRWSRWKLVVPLAAAAVLAVVVVPKVVGVKKQGAIASTYAMALGQNPQFGRALIEGWDQRGWAVTRGSDEAGAGTVAVGSQESKLAFRLGARTVDIQIAVQRGDTTVALRLIAEIQETLKSVGYAELIAQTYDDLKDHLASDPLARSIERASDAEREVYQHLKGSPSFEFGQWVAAADLAARTHDAAFFDSSRGTAFVRSRAAGGLTGDDSTALQEIDGRLTKGADERALDDVHTVLEGVIRRRGS
ncbi:MAG TPA: hypothetical protein VIP11_07085 [Gemmatimonadaceae bacterium]